MTSFADMGGPTAVIGGPAVAASLAQANGRASLMSKTIVGTYHVRNEEDTAWRCIWEEGVDKAKI